MDSEEKKYNSYVIDKDYCPDQDCIIYRKTCDNCQYYCGFEMYLGQPCIRCSFYKQQ